MEETYKPVFAALQSTIRAASGVAAQDISFYRRLDESLDQSAQKQSGKLLDLANFIMQNAAKGEVDELVAEDRSDDLTDNWHEVNTALDTLTFKIDDCLSAHRKQQKKEDEKTEEGDKADTDGGDMIKLSDGRATTSGQVNRHQYDLPKPQLKFMTAVDNSKDKPFKPHLTSKPNATISFEDSVKLVEPSADTELERPYFPQPYEREIMGSSYPKSLYSKKDPVPSLPWSTTEAIWIDTTEKLNKMIEQIATAPEIAIDLEHHDYRSFLGITCLLQLSDRKSDFIIDTLALRDNLQPLNEIFTNPNIVKVLHGASMDIIWLQRDLGLYIVSLFDTFHASKRLGLKRNGLAYLLETYANFQTSKKYQLADWRIRPIPSEMLSYAQSDTHFLLNIYDKIKNQLIEQNVLPEVLEESRKTASQRFETPGYDVHSCASNPFNEPIEKLATKNNLDRKQRVFFEALYNWRDETARRIDESPSFVMPVHTLITLSTAIPLKAGQIIHKAGPHGTRLREYSKELQKIMYAASKVAEATAAEPEETTAPSTLASADDESILSNFDTYESIVKKATEDQKSLFNPKSISAAVKKIQQPVSKFWGVTLLALDQSPEDVSLFFPIDHIPDGITLYSGNYEASAQQDNAKEQEKSDEPSEPVKDDKNLVFIGQSNNTQSFSSTLDAIRDQDAKASNSSDTILMPTTAELLGSDFRLLTKKERKQMKREKRALEEDAASEENKASHAVPKAEKKYKRKNKRAISEATEDSANAGAKKQKTDEAAPFDFASAPSVLNGDSSSSKRKSKAKKEFNPYSDVSTALEGASKKNISTNVRANTSVSYKVSKSKKK